MPVLTVREVAEKYRVSPPTVRGWIGKGLPIKKIGKVVRIEEKDLEDFVTAQSKLDSSALTGGDTEK